MAKKTPNFEKALGELETLVDEMEQGNLSLEESLKRFEKGIALSSECQQALQNAELKITQLIEKNGKLMEQETATQSTDELTGSTELDE
jgi:exodeoxyribonuclease VII small subunit